MQVFDIESRFQQEMFLREARAEKFSCALWIAVICTTYAVFLLQPDVDPILRTNIAYLVVATVPIFCCFYLLILFDRYTPAMAYINTLTQLTVVSGAVYFDTIAYGTQYALSSMPPIAYGLVVIVTAFRLRAMMGVFAGTVAAGQFLLIYAIVNRSAPDMTPELLAAVPSLDWEVTIMKVMVIFGLGVAGSFSAYSLRKELFNFMASARQEYRLHSSLGRYVSKSVAEVVAGDDSQALAPRKAEVVVMFGDIRNFTKFSNATSAEEVSELINGFFDRVGLAVENHGGLLNKFLGDGFMAVFGLFEEDDDARTNAIRAAFELVDSSKEYLNDKDMDIGIAINYGSVIAGEIGSADRCEYTVIGNSVNIAARLEGMNRKLGTRILITQEFLHALPDGLIEFESKGFFNIRGIPGEMELIEATKLLSSDSVN